MASRPIKKLYQYVIKSNFYDQLDEDDSEFLGNWFAGEDGENNAFGSDSDIDSSEEIQRDETCDVEVGNVEEEELENEVQHRQKFRNLDEVVDEDNYVDPESQPDLANKYSDAKNTVNITWQTVTERNFKKITVANILRRKPGPGAAAKYVKAHLDTFQFFVSNEKVENIVKFTNAVIETAIERFSAARAKSDKYTYFRVIDSDDIRAYIGIMYLRASF